jgi:hypothetical protein
MTRSEWLETVREFIRIAYPSRAGEEPAYMRPWERLSARAADPPPAEAPAKGDDGQWLRLAAVARGLGFFTGEGKKRRPNGAHVSRLGLDDNGKTGRARRIKRRSVEEFCFAQGLNWNEAAASGRKGVAGL